MARSDDSPVKRLRSRLARVVIHAVCSTNQAQTAWIVDLHGQLSADKLEGPWQDQTTARSNVCARALRERKRLTDCQGGEGGQGGGVGPIFRLSQGGLP